MTSSSNGSMKANVCYWWLQRCQQDAQGKQSTLDCATGQLTNVRKEAEDLRQQLKVQQQESSDAKKAEADANAALAEAVKVC